MAYVKVEDVKSTVVSVTSTDPGPEAGHTVYDEAWNGPTYWDSEETECKRKGIDDYIIKKKANKRTKSRKKRGDAQRFLDDFHGTNLENLDDGTWLQADIDAIRDDVDIQKLHDLSVSGNLEEMKAVIDAKLTTNPWFKQARKDKLSSKLQKYINKAGEL